MSNFAVISGNTVINIIVADSKEIAEMVTGSTCQEITDEFPAKMNWQYVPEEDKWYDAEELYY